MHVLYLTCPQCDHTGMTRIERAITSHMQAKRFKARCSKCGAKGMSDQFKASLSFYKDVNPYRQNESVEG